jgi:hypothetical protein
MDVERKSMTPTTTQPMTSTMTSAGHRTVRRKLDGSPTETPELHGDGGNGSDGGAIKPSLQRVAAAL